MVRREGEEPTVGRQVYTRCEDCLRAGRLVGAAYRWTRPYPGVVAKKWMTPGYPDAWHGDVILGWWHDGEYYPHEGEQVPHPTPRDEDDLTAGEAERGQRAARQILATSPWR